MIKEIGVLINKNIKDIDGFRTTQVYIRGAEHIPPSAVDVPRLMSELVYRNKKEKDESVFNYIARFHIMFERIHPFTDGNGRTGRLIITKELLSRGLAPIVIPLEYRDKYLDLLTKQNVLGLSSLLKHLNELEVERMSKFGINL